MKYIIGMIGVFCMLQVGAKSRTIHLFVSLSDNATQNIKVPEGKGVGTDLDGNFLWGAQYGVRTFFKKNAREWMYMKNVDPENENVLERLIFKHKTEDVYLIADAYKGDSTINCITDFLLASNGQNGSEANHHKIGGWADLVVYVGQDGLKDHHPRPSFKELKEDQIEKNVIALTSNSGPHFSRLLKRAKADPLVLTVGEVIPEAYTLRSMIKSWIAKEDGHEMASKAAGQYHRYQLCGLREAKQMFITGFYH